MDIEALKNKMKKHSMEISKLESFFNQQYNGKVVKCPAGKYKGRDSIIDGCHYNSFNGFTVLLMVLRVDGTGVLNADCDSRSYWGVGLIDFETARPPF